MHFINKKYTEYGEEDELLNSIVKTCNEIYNTYGKEYDEIIYSLQENLQKLQDLTEKSLPKVKRSERLKLAKILKSNYMKLINSLILNYSIFKKSDDNMSFFDISLSPNGNILPFVDYVNDIGGMQKLWEIFKDLTEGVRDFKDNGIGKGLL